jgi:hypothetical protein
MKRLFCLVCLALLVVSTGCRGDVAGDAAGAEPAPLSVTPDTEGPEDPVLELGDWTTYPDPPVAELEPEGTEPLDDDRWARVSAELACAGRVERGDAGAHRVAARRVLHFHKTTAKAVMDYGIAVNLDAARASRLGELVAGAAERCR